MGKSVKYLRSKSTCFVPIIQVEEQFELQYNEEHIVEKVKVGDLDIHKECCSHFNEVGLINVCKAAIARGENPLVKFGKYEPGVPVGLDPNMTLDEFNEVIQEQSKQYQAIADTLGMTVDEVKAAVANGTIGSIIEAKTKQQPVAEEGGAE